MTISTFIISEEQALTDKGCKLNLAGIGQDRSHRNGFVYLAGFCVARLPLRTVTHRFFCVQYVCVARRVKLNAAFQTTDSRVLVGPGAAPARAIKSWGTLER